MSAATDLLIIESLRNAGANVDHPAANLKEWVNDYRQQVEERMLNGDKPQVVVKKIDTIPSLNREVIIYDIPESVLLEAAEVVIRLLLESVKS